MYFAYPWVLLLLVIPIMLAWWEWRRPGLRVKLPFDYAGAAKRPGLRRLIGYANLLPMIVVAAGLMILAGPRRELTGVTEQEMRNIQMLLDVSGSMRSPYGKQNRYDAAMAAIKQFTTFRKGDAFGLSVFGGEVINWVPLTKDLSAIRLAAPFLRPEVLPTYMSDTEIGKGLLTVKNLLEEHPGPRMIILLTDGQSADLGPRQTMAVSKALSAANIKVYSIFIGDNESTVDIATIARLTGGKFFRAGDPTLLAETFQRIDEMEPTKFKPVGRNSVDWFGPLAIVGLGVLGVQLISGFGLRYTPW